MSRGEIIEINSTQEVIKKTQSSLLLREFFGTVMVFIKITEILQFYNSKYSDKAQVTEKQEFSPKNYSCITLKRPKKEVPTLSFMYSAGFH